jgi:hypothetical protein
MEIQWTDERNRLVPETIEGILQCMRFNIVLLKLFISVRIRSRPAVL